MSDIRHTEKNPRFFYEAGDFPFLKPLVDNYVVIKNELAALEEKRLDKNWLNTFPGYVKSDKDKAWQVFSLSLFCMKFEVNTALCPKTAELVFSIPEIISSNYSYVKPRTHILPHTGYSRMQLRCHLPLIIPDKNLCALRVGSETRHWEEGKLMIFDDSYEHEAWNNTDAPRVVLMFDIPNPLWGYTAKEISRYKLEHLDDAFLLGLASKEKWLEGFEKGIAPI